MYKPATSNTLTPGDIVIAKQYDRIVTKDFASERSWFISSSGHIYLVAQKRLIPFPRDPMLIIAVTTSEKEPTNTRYALLGREQGIVSLCTDDLHVSRNCIIILERTL